MTPVAKSRGDFDNAVVFYRSRQVAYVVQIVGDNDQRHGTFCGGSRVDGARIVLRKKRWNRRTENRRDAARCNAKGLIRLLDRLVDQARQLRTIGCRRFIRPPLTVDVEACIACVVIRQLDRCLLANMGFSRSFEVGVRFPRWLKLG